MDVFGSFGLILAFVCDLYAFGGGIAAIIIRHPLLIKSARQSGMATSCAISMLLGKSSLCESRPAIHACRVNAGNKHCETFGVCSRAAP